MSLPQFSHTQTRVQREFVSKRKSIDDCLFLAYRPRGLSH